MRTKYNEENGTYSIFSFALFLVKKKSTEGETKVKVKDLQMIWLHSIGSLQ